MLDRSFLRWPFFEERHRALADQLETWAAQHCAHVDHRDVDAACRGLVRNLGRDGWLKHTAPGEGPSDKIDVRTLALVRETLARHSGLADFAFAMQGLGAGPISLFGTPAQKARWLPKTRGGVAIAAFALSEPASGSDVANISMTARRSSDGFTLDGEKTWISNGGIADLYVVFARTGEAAGAKGLSAFIVRSDNPGLSVAERIEVMAPHPLARLTFKDCRVGTDDLIGAPGDGFKIAMATLDVFRTSVGAAALGFARRALAETTQARQEPRIVRRSIVGIADGPGPHCRYGGRDRRGGASCLSRRVDQGHGCGARDARGSDGETLRDRGGAACDRRRRADSWW